MEPAEVIAIIPARGGSKGIPRKNLHPILGKPLLAYSIQQAAATRSITRMVVSTDNPEIGDVARQYGAEVVRRPEEISDDAATSESALLHALDELREKEGYTPDLVVFLQATSPLRQAHDIQRAIDTLCAARADSLFSACPVHGFIWRQCDDHLVSLTYDYRNRQRRQQLSGQDLLENGSIYVFKPWVLRQFGNRLGGKIAVHYMDVLDSFQIDAPGDLALVERLMPLREAQEPRGELGSIQLLVLDFDGVLTDNRVLVDQDGVEAVWCHRGDGWRIARLRETGVDVIVISTEANPVVTARCRKLRIESVQDCSDKLRALQVEAERRGLKPNQVAYVGNDMNDVACMQWVGTPIAVSDATPGIRALARFVTGQPGGEGAVREVCDWLIQAKRGHNA